MIVVLPTDVIVSGFIVRVLEGGRQLLVTCNWPKSLLDRVLFHDSLTCLPSTNRDYLPESHPKKFGFEEGLSELCSIANES